MFARLLMAKKDLQAVVQQTSKPASEMQAMRQKPLDITAESLKEFICNQLMVLISVKYCLMTPALRV